MADPNKYAQFLRDPDQQALDDFNRIEMEGQKRPWYQTGLPMEGRATFLPFKDSMEGSVFNQREWALPAVIAGAVNAFTSPERARTGTDQTFNPNEEALNFAQNVMGGGIGTSSAMKAPMGQGGKDLSIAVGKGFTDEGNFRRVGINQPVTSEIWTGQNNPSGISGVIEGVGTGAKGSNAADVAAANAEVKRLIANPEINPFVQIAKEINPNYDYFAIQKMPTSSIEKQFPIAKTYEALTSADKIDPQLERLIFAEYLKKYPDLIKKSDATTYKELTQAAYEKLRQENNQQFDALLNNGMNFSYHTGDANYLNSPEMLRDSLLNKHLYTYRGGDKHEFLNKVDPYVGLNDNEKFRAVHDIFGHATTGSGFSRLGEEVAYGAHGQVYSPLAKIAAATETRGQNSFVNYSGLNTDLQRAMDKVRFDKEKALKAGQDVSKYDEQLRDLGSQWQYAKQSALILPPEMVDPMYRGGLPEYMKPFIQSQNPQEYSAWHWSNNPNLSETNPQMYGTGIKGAESERLNLPNAPKDRSYFYTKPQLRESGLGANQYEAQLKNLYDPTKDPEKLVSMASMYNKHHGIVDESAKANDWERMIKEAGYSGYVNPYSNTAIMFEPQQVSKVKK
ncbi:hypothetical protein UFOVP20_32 [uncultured Caudovirales phage]|uniref:Uncharacterized protein n=1 Tax=uncultured Caudovirales phage TaxID=2100421 RepID=A0A6J5KJX8_9CAUD|nr:hypothetical protein UFOVP20_32 [uncultured Caudovirales phage]